MQVDKKELIKYRLNRARETLEEAKISIENKRYLLAANRIYYTSFYAVESVLRQFRKVNKSRTFYPYGDALKKCFILLTKIYQKSGLYR